VANNPKTRLAYPLPADGEGMGIPTSETQPSLQTEAFKELVNKLSWAIGSTFRSSYSSPKSPARELAVRVAKRIMELHGYPRTIARERPGPPGDAYGSSDA